MRKEKVFSQNLERIIVLMVSSFTCPMLVDDSNQNVGWRFHTFRGGILRTVGCGRQSRGAVQREADLPGEARFYAEQRGWLDEDKATAKGKVFKLHRNEDGTSAYEVFQVCGSNAESCFCGNASAAVGAVLGNLLGSRTVVAHVQNGAVTHEINFELHPRREGNDVAQTWKVTGVRGVLHESFDERGSVSIGVNFLNEYQIKLLTKPQQHDGDSVKITQTAGKAAVVDPFTTPPTVRFYNCNGRHGSAPQTGLVTLAIARMMWPRLKAALLGCAIECPNGWEVLPEVSLDTDVALFQLPLTTVLLKEISVL